MASRGISTEFLERGGSGGLASRAGSGGMFSRGISTDFRLTAVEVGREANGASRGGKSIDVRIGRGASLG
jgi:hypothetical protein